MSENTYDEPEDQAVERIDVKVLPALMDKIVEAATRQGMRPSRWLGVLAASQLGLAESEALPPPKLAGRRPKPRKTQAL